MEIDLLSEEFIPPSLPFRENEIREIKRKIEKFEEFGKFSDLLIFGSSGSGKTASIKLLSQEIKTKLIYINCWNYNDSLSIFQKILENFSQILPKRGISKEEILERLTEINKKFGKYVLVLDEIDKVKDLNDLLYFLTREAKNVFLIMISNSKDFLLNLDQRVLSSLNLETIEFKKYSLEQLKEIAKYRLKLLRVEVEEGVPFILANESFKKNSDVRIILKLIRIALEKMIEENEKILRVSHLKKVIKNLDNNEKIEDERLKKILEIVRNSEKITTSEVYEILKKEYKISKRTFNYLVKKLVDEKRVKLIRAKGIKGCKYFITLI
jgi:cell division control protein 6